MGSLVDFSVVIKDIYLGSWHFLLTSKPGTMLGANVLGFLIPVAVLVATVFSPTEVFGLSKLYLLKENLLTYNLRR